MVDDARSSRKPKSAVATLAAGSNSAVTLADLMAEEAMSIEQLRMQYDANGTTEAVVEVYDDSDGTAAADLEGKVDEFRLSPGDDTNPDMEWKDIEDDIILLADGNSDAAVTVTVGGYILSG